MGSTFTLRFPYILQPRRGEKRCEGGRYKNEQEGNPMKSMSKGTGKETLNTYGMLRARNYLRRW